MQRTLVLGLAFVLGLAAVSAAGSQSAADDYPQRNVTFLCPFPAGGGTDILTRILAAELQDKLKRTVIVENRPGGGTIIAAQQPRARLPTVIRSSSRR
jgi:tripartite-type tricarboxylate transporter receptor subunit TctC